MKTIELITYLNDFLRCKEINDYSKNGLQIEGPDTITKVAFAVDSCQASFKQAVIAGAQLLIVHHGLFWDKPYVLVGPMYHQVKILINGNCNLYAVHLPMDMHPEIGNNAELARKLELKNIRSFAEYNGNKIGIGGELDHPIPIDRLVNKLTQIIGESPLCVLAHGPKEAKKIGCISGSAAELIDQVVEAGFDTYITGETKHTFFHHAAEWGINLIYGGHYATETLGLKALAQHLAKKFKLETTFIDVPTGM
jgi:dinuclear metal center YbgI/SA1388 family protein